MSIREPGERFARRPPAVVRAVFRALLSEDEQEVMLGDLTERRPDSWAVELIAVVVYRFTKARPLSHTHLQRGVFMFQDLSADVRFGLRTMMRSPAFSAVALLTMAVGIGATTAMFSLVNAVLLRSLPYPAADRIVMLTETNLSRGWPSFRISPLNFWDWQDRNQSLERVAAFQETSVTFSRRGEPAVVRAYQATEDFMPILGASPVVGRRLTVDDMSPASEPVAVLTHGFWQRAFGGDLGVLGQPMTIDGVTTTVVGVLPAGWRSFSNKPVDVILPLRPQPYWHTSRGSHMLTGLGLLRDGATSETAQTDLSAIASALEQAYPDTNRGWGARVQPLRDALVGSASLQLMLLTASVSLVLLIACGNLANMLFARALGRTREMAVRTALGATRPRLLRQLIAESTILTAVGGALGVGLAAALLAAFVRTAPASVPRLAEVDIDAAVLAFSVLVSLLAGVASGLVPGMGLFAARLNDVLRQGATSVVGGRARRWTQSVLVTAEVGLAVVLVIGSGLLVRSYAVLSAHDPGFGSDDRLVLGTPLSRGRYQTAEAVNDFASRTLRGMEALPGVEHAAFTSLVPLEGADEIWGYWLEEHAVAGAQSDGSATAYRVGPAYFAAMGIPILEGRAIAPPDNAEAPRVVVVGKSFAERHFGSQSAIGRRIRFGVGPDEPATEIIGVVGEVEHNSLGQSTIPQLYVPFLQRPTRDVYWVLKTSVPPESLVAYVRAAVSAADPDQPVVGVQTAEAMVSGSIALARFRTTLMTGFGVVAALLALVGLYGVVAYAVTQRTREIGVRIALGATRRSILGLILQQGAPFVGLGLGCGLPRWTPKSGH